MRLFCGQWERQYAVLWRIFSFFRGFSLFLVPRLFSLARVHAPRDKL